MNHARVRLMTVLAAIAILAVVFVLSSPTKVSLAWRDGGVTPEAAAEIAGTALVNNDAEEWQRISDVPLSAFLGDVGLERVRDYEIFQWDGPDQPVFQLEGTATDGLYGGGTVVFALTRNLIGRWVLTGWHLSA